MPKPKRDHYLPAAFIGGFGIQHPEKRRREAKVIERTKSPDAISDPQAAQTFGYGTDMYKVQQPTPKLAADYAERWWGTYERDLPDAVKALETGTWAVKDWAAVLRHIQAVWPRHPDFSRDVAAQKARQGVNGLAGDDLEYMRQAALDENASVLAAARFALLRRYKSADRFVTNDKGYHSMHDLNGAPAAVFFPMTASTGVMMALGAARPGDDHQLGPHAERTVNVKGVDFLNTGLWNQIGIRSVLGHPDDRDYIAALRDLQTPQKAKIRLGPYHGNREMFLDWSRDIGIRRR